MSDLDDSDIAIVYEKLSHFSGGKIAAQFELDGEVGQPLIMLLLKIRQARTTLILQLGPR